jgi:Bax protein
MNIVYKKSLVNKLFQFSLLIALVIALLAPFIFLKPNNSSDNLVKSDFIKADKSNTGKKSLTEKVKPKSPEKPLHKLALPNFVSIKDVRTKKVAFFNFIKPSITKQVDEILVKRTRIESYLTSISLEIPLTDEELYDISMLATEYKVKKSLSLLTQLNQLHSKIDIVPVPLVLVQAANESAWGTSRFARIGLNYFGIWCYRKGCGMVPNGRTGGERHEVAAFQSVDKAVASYFKNINTHNAYMTLRTIRAQLRAQNQPLIPKVLATGLIPYSERGVDYVIDINTMLRQNQAFF